MKKTFYSSMKLAIVAWPFQPFLWIQKRSSSFFDVHSWGVRAILTSRLQNPDKLKIKMLDIGAGSKPFRSLFEEKGFTYESCDLHENRIDKHTFLADATQIPVKSESFDLLTSFQVFEHLREPWIAVDEWSRILKPQGYLIITTNFNYPVHGHPIDFFRFTSEGLENILIKAGFGNIEVIKLGSNLSLALIKIFYSMQTVTKNGTKKYLSAKHFKKIVSTPLYILIMLITVPIINTILLILASPLLLIDRIYTSKKAYICIVAIAKK